MHLVLIVKPSKGTTIGEYHNLALQYLFAQSSWDIGPVATLQDYQNLVDSLKDFLISQGFDVTDFDNNAALILDSLQSIQAFYEKGNQTFFGFPVQSEQEVIPYVVNQLVAQGVITPVLRDALVQINAMTFDPEIPLSQVVSFVENEFLDMFPKGPDHDVAVLFADVFSHSADYWLNNPDVPLASGDAVIIADAAGALYGLLCTFAAPVWSIIEAAAFSLIANNATLARPDIVLLGDVNLDGVVSLLDVGPFVDLLTSGEFQAEADINLDGVVNLLDVGPFVAILSGG